MKKLFLLSLFSLLALFSARAEIANVDDTGDGIANEAVTFDGIHYVLRNLALLEDMPDLPASIQSIGRNALSMTNTETKHTLIVPDAGYDAYKSTAPWSNFANIVKKTSTGISAAPMTVGTERIEVYDLNGRIIYRGAANRQPALTSGAYVVKRGAKTAKAMMP